MRRTFFDDHVEVIHVKLHGKGIPHPLSKLVSEYREAMVWADTPDDERDAWAGAELSPDALAKSHNDCRSFYERAQPIIEELGDGETYHYGHDFWLTRQGHGAGFWDGDYPEPAATKLTELAQTFGESYLYLGDTGKIHLGDE